MRKRIDVLENKIDVLENKIDVLENACVTMQRKFEMLVQQIQRDARLIQAHEMKIAHLEALHQDDYK